MINTYLLLSWQAIRSYFPTCHFSGTMKEFCSHGTRADCRQIQTHLCDKVHFRRLVHQHTDVNLGDCSFLNTCFHMDTCKVICGVFYYSDTWASYLTGLLRLRFVGAVGDWYYVKSSFLKWGLSTTTTWAQDLSSSPIIIMYTGFLVDFRDCQKLTMCVLHEYKLQLKVKTHLCYTIARTMCV